MLAKKEKQKEKMRRREKRRQDAIKAKRLYDQNQHRKRVEEAFPIYMNAMAQRRRKGGHKVTDVSLSFELMAPDNTLLLENTELKVVFGRRYGLVGRNGTGKTTLLRNISTYQIKHFPRTLKVLHVEQEMAGNDKTVLQCVIDSDIERNHILAEKDALEKNASDDNSERLSEIYDRLQELEAWSAEARATQILTGLQFTAAQQNMRTSDLSGGWRMRVSLASALFVNPDVLMLDEPTNHLDFQAVIWLQDYLVNDFKNSLIVVSHDRDFLDEVVTDIMLLNNKKQMEYFRGDFTSFCKVKEERYKATKRAYDAQKMKIEHIEEYINTYYTSKKSAAQDKMIGQVQSKQKQLDKMERLPDPDLEDGRKFTLRFPDPCPLRIARLFDCKNLYFNYPTTTKSGIETPGMEKREWLLEDINCRMEKDGRVGLLGTNGCGKSTLLKLVMEELESTEGLVVKNSAARIALFAQHHIDMLNLGLSSVEQLRTLFPTTPEKECRSYLGRFGLGGNRLNMQIGNLSGGQKSRLVFAILTWQEPHLLILDEPTNHLDMETIDDIINAVREYKGAVLAVSHDVYFLRKTMSRYWTIHEGKLREFETIEQCKKFLLN